MLTPKQVKFIQEELETAKHPLFIYDDDGDGLASFLLLYRIHRLGRGHVLKAHPKIDNRMLKKVEEINPDKLFILDIPLVEQEFVDNVKKPIIYLDHHQPLDLKNVHYFNPRIKDPSAYLPTTVMAYQVNGKAEDMWIAVVGSLADYHLPDFIGVFVEKYPRLLAASSDLEKAIYQNPVGKLVKLFNFILKGKHSEVVKCIKILTRINSPEEILEQKTSPGRFLYKRFESVNVKYESLLQEAKKQVGRGKLLLFHYLENKWSFTANLANELSVLYPKKVVLICRRNAGEIKCSLRAKFPVLNQLEKALVGVEGYGGGHENACGAVIKEGAWEQFLGNFRKELKIKNELKK